MSSNSSSSPTVSPPLLTLCDYLNSCFKTTAGVINVTAITVSNILLLLPLCILVLFLGYQQSRQQRSGSISNADLLAHNMVIMELVKILGATLTSFGAHTDRTVVSTLGVTLWSVDLCGHIFFHLLAGVENYLAVVHPVTYMNLRTANGIRGRNISIGCIWLLCCAISSLAFTIDYILITILFFCLFALTLIIISICGVSVLYVLFHPGPGEAGGAAQQVSPSKSRAFYTITAIVTVLVLRLGGSALTVALHNGLRLGKNERCGLFMSLLWFSLPSSLVSPLLFLQRAGKLSCCKNSKGTSTRYD